MSAGFSPCGIDLGEIASLNDFFRNLSSPSRDAAKRQIPGANSPARHAREARANLPFPSECALDSPISSPRFDSNLHPALFI
jgi:hypothetical protein